MRIEQWNGLKGIQEALKNYKDISRDIALQLSRTSHKHLESPVIVRRTFFSDGDYGIEIISIADVNIDEMNDLEMGFESRSERITYRTKTGNLKYYNPETDTVRTIGNIKPNEIK